MSVFPRFMLTHFPALGPSWVIFLIVVFAMMELTDLVTRVLVS